MIVTTTYLTLLASLWRRGEYRAPASSRRAGRKQSGRSTKRIAPSSVSASCQQSTRAAVSEPD